MKAFMNILLQFYSLRRFVGLLLFTAAIYLLITNRISIYHHSRLSQLSSSLERDDWKIYPLGCHLIQLPEDYTIFVDLNQTYGGVYYIIRRPAPGENLVQTITKEPIPYMFGTHLHHWLPMIDSTEDFEETDVVKEKYKGLIFRKYYLPSSRNSKDRVHTLRGVLVLPPIPTAERIGILFDSFAQPGSEEIELFPEILKTFRVDQRLFGELTRKEGDPNPIADSIDLEFGAFELRSFTVKEFNAIPGEMDQTPHRREEELDCADFRLSVPSPEHWVRSILEKH